MKTAELPPDQNYVLGSHPHGIMGTGIFCNFSTDSNNFSQLFPGLRPQVAALAGLFRLPVFREYIMFNGEPECSSPAPELPPARTPTRDRDRARALAWGRSRHQLGMLVHDGEGGLEGTESGARSSHTKGGAEELGVLVEAVTAPRCSRPQERVL